MPTRIRSLAYTRCGLGVSANPTGKLNRSRGLKKLNVPAFPRQKSPSFSQIVRTAPDSSWPTLVPSSLRMPAIEKSLHELGTGIWVGVILVAESGCPTAAPPISST